jgi:tryptophan-rich sensory protein
MPAVEQILTILFVRSVLFLLACLSILALWQKSERSLLLRLGFALFVLVGLLYMLSADWMPVSVRLPHTLEIMADEFVYAWVLVKLLRPSHAAAQSRESLQPEVVS